jgi:hypothetical protein
MKKSIAVTAVIMLMGSVTAFATSKKGSIDTIVNQATAENMQAISNGTGSTAAAGSIAIQGNDNKIDTVVNKASAGNMQAISNGNKSTAAAGSIAIQGANKIGTIVNAAGAGNMQAISNGEESTAAAGTVTLNACKDCDAAESH